MRLVKLINGTVSLESNDGATVIRSFSPERDLEKSGNKLILRNGTDVYPITISELTSIVSDTAVVTDTTGWTLDQFIKELRINFFFRVGGSGTTNATREQFEEVNGVFQIKQSWLTIFINQVVNGEMPPLNKSVISFENVTANQIGVKWTAVPNATSYVVKRGSTTIYTGAALSFADTGLLASANYGYTVIASANGYISSTSDVANQSTQTAGGGSDAALFAETFPNTTGVQAALSTVNWRMVDGNGYGSSDIPQTATSIKQFAGGSLTTSVNAGYNTVTNLGYLEYEDNKLAQLIYTEKYTLDTSVTLPSKVKFDLATSVIGSTSIMTKTFVLVKVGGNFYIYDSAQQPANPSTGNFGSPSAIEVPLDFTTPNKWRLVVILDGSTPVIKVGAAVASLPKGPTNFGIMCTSEGIGQGNNGTDGATFGNRKINLDSYQVI